MFSALAARFSAQLDEIKGVVRWQDELRSVVHSVGSLPAPIAIDAASLMALQARAPQRIAWQVFDHCASVTRIYALFEEVVCNIVTEYLSYLPRVAPAYGSLNERLRTQHRIGVGAILTKWSQSNGPFQSIAERDISGGLVDGLRGIAYTVLADAFLVSPENFRSSALDRLFGDLGFGSVMAFVKKSETVQEFLKTRLASGDTVESYLDVFVRIRNEASHGNIATLASANEIANYADFLVLIIDSFATLLRSDLVKAGLGTGATLDIAEVVHVYSNNVVGVEARSLGPLKTGDRLCVGKKRIEFATVLSLQIGPAAHNELQLNPGMQFGVRLDRTIGVGAHLYSWVP